MSYATGAKIGRPRVELTPEKAEEIRLKRNEKNRRYKSRRKQLCVVGEYKPEVRREYGITDPREITRRIAIVRRAKTEYMAEHGHTKLPRDVLHSLDLEGGGE